MHIYFHSRLSLYLPRVQTVEDNMSYICVPVPGIVCWSFKWNIENPCSHKSYTILLYQIKCDLCLSKRENTNDSIGVLNQTKLMTSLIIVCTLCSCPDAPGEEELW